MRWLPFVSLVVVACGSRTQLDGATDASTIITLDASDAPDVDLTSLPPSCQGIGPGLSDCGVDHDSCCATLDVPGGTFFRTYTNTPDDGVQNTADPATVSALRLDKYLVT